MELDRQNASDIGAVNRVLDCGTLYEVLELREDCDGEDVRQAYRQLAAKIHPDKNKAPRVNDAFTVVQKAYETLGDLEKKEQYDLTLIRDGPGGTCQVGLTDKMIYYLADKLEPAGDWYRFGFLLGIPYDKMQEFTGLYMNTWKPLTMLNLWISRSYGLTEEQKKEMLVLALEEMQKFGLADWVTQSNESLVTISVGLYPYLQDDWEALAHKLKVNPEQITLIRAETGQVHRHHECAVRMLRFYRDTRGRLNDLVRRLPTHIVPDFGNHFALPYASSSLQLEQDTGIPTCIGPVAGRTGQDCPEHTECEHVPGFASTEHGNLPQWYLDNWASQPTQWAKQGHRVGAAVLPRQQQTEFNVVGQLLAGLFATILGFASLCFYVWMNQTDITVMLKAVGDNYVYSYESNSIFKGETPFYNYPVNISRVFIKPRLVENHPLPDYTRSEVSFDADELFEEGEKVYILKGEVGSGKSVLLLYYLMSWYHIQEHHSELWYIPTTPITHIDLPIYIRPEDCQKSLQETVRAAVYKYGDDIGKRFYHIWMTSKKDVALLIDSLDEIYHRKALINDIVALMRSRQVLIIACARTEHPVLQHLYNVQHKSITIQGLTAKDITQFSEKFLGQNAIDGQRFFEQGRSSIFMTSPLLLTLSCILIDKRALKLEDLNTNTVLEMYGAVEALYLKREDNNCTHEMIKQFHKLALNVTLNNTLTFSVTLLREYGIHCSTNELPFVQELEQTLTNILYDKDSKNKTIKWRHKYFQELAAAKAVEEASPVERKKLLESLTRDETTHPVLFMFLQNIELEVDVAKGLVNIMDDVFSKPRLRLLQMMRSSMPIIYALPESTRVEMFHSFMDSLDISNRRQMDSYWTWLAPPVLDAARYILIARSVNQIVVFAWYLDDIIAAKDSVTDVLEDVVLSNKNQLYIHFTELCSMWGEPPEHSPALWSEIIHLSVEADTSALVVFYGHDEPIFPLLTVATNTKLSLPLEAFFLNIHGGYINGTDLLHWWHKHWWRHYSFLDSKTTCLANNYDGMMVKNHEGQTICVRLFQTELTCTVRERLTFHRLFDIRSVRLLGLTKWEILTSSFLPIQLLCCAVIISIFLLIALVSAPSPWWVLVLTVLLSLEWVSHLIKIVLYLSGSDDIIRLINDRGDPFWFL